MYKGCSALATPMNFREASEKRSRINTVSPGRIGMVLTTAKVPVLHGLGRDTHVALQAVKIGRRIAQDGTTAMVDLSGANPLQLAGSGNTRDDLADVRATPHGHQGPGFARVRLQDLGSGFFSIQRMSGISGKAQASPAMR